MAEKLHFDLVSPEKLLYSATADMVVVPGSEGDFGVLAGHAPLISIVRTGVIDVKGSEDGADLKIALISNRFPPSRIVRVVLPDDDRRLHEAQGVGRLKLVRFNLF